MTVVERVLAQLRKGPVLAADFDRQPAIDGGNRHTRVAARITDLKNQGHEIGSRRVKLGNATVAEYFLIREAGAPAKSVGIANGLRDVSSPAGFGPAWADTKNPQAPSAYADEEGVDWWDEPTRKDAA